MKTKELRALSTDDLRVQLDQACKEMMNLRFQFTMGQQNDTSRLRIARRHIARIRTLLREREIESAPEGKAQ
ncbi:MAG: 50S ribosomal protein L29 [Anaerolineales bacterium]|nr:50S ribosomal protein L29 [Anaerolineales bacterium]